MILYLLINMLFHSYLHFGERPRPLFCGSDDSASSSFWLLEEGRTTRLLEIAIAVEAGVEIRIEDDEADVERE